MSFESFMNGVQVGAPLAGFMICDTDMAGGIDTQYYGYMALNGCWYIHRQIVSAGQFSYCYGVKGYAAAWAGRAALVFTYPDGSAL